MNEIIIFLIIVILAAIFFFNLGIWHERASTSKEYYSKIALINQKIVELETKINFLIDKVNF